VFVFVMVLLVFVLMGVMMPVFMMMVVFIVIVMMVIFNVNVELGALNVGLLAARGVNMKFVEVQLFQFVLQLPKIDAKVEHRADKHIAADAAEHVEIKRLHSNSPAASALI
jgi:hypothetical protein